MSGREWIVCSTRHQQWQRMRYVLRISIQSTLQYVAFQLLRLVINILLLLRLLLLRMAVDGGYL